MRFDTGLSWDYLQDVVLNPAFPSPNTERPAAAYGRWRETALRPSFADQTFRRMLSTLRRAVFLRERAVRIRRLSLNDIGINTKSVGQNPT